MSKILFDNTTSKIKTVLVKFDDENVGINARNGSAYRALDPNSVPISKGQATFTINGHKSCNASHTQFPLTLSRLLRYTSARG